MVLDAQRGNSSTTRRRESVSYRIATAPPARLIDSSRTARLACVALAALIAAACAAPAPPITGAPGRRPPPETPGFQPSDLAKSDIDAVVEAHQDESLATVKVLAEKLYRRNPREWRKGGYPSMQAAIARAFDRKYHWRFPELDGVQGTAAIQLALRPEFGGDRVFAFTVGLGSMIHQAYNEQYEFYMFDTLEPQSLYNAARNVEIAVWKLSNARDASGHLLLLTNEIDGGTRNLSFEREFGKLIAYQDMLARVLAQRQNRTIRYVVQSLATAVFLPVPVK